MKASSRPHLRSLAALAALILTVACSRGQDVVVLKDKSVREGQITSVSSGNVRIKIGPAEVAVPLAQVSTVSMAPPADFEKIQAIARTGDAAKTLPPLKALVDKFAGLPTDWAKTSTAMLGSVYLDLGNFMEAEKAFGDFQAAYPDDSNMADVGLAELAIKKDDLAGARAKLEPIVGEARSIKMAGTGKNATYGDALFLMGQLQEKEGSLPEALENYLLVVTVFSGNPDTTPKAQARADFLEKEKKVLVP